MAILARIQSRESTYNHHKWENDRRKNESLLQMISEYNLPKMSTSYRKRSVAKLQRLMDTEEDEEDMERYYDETAARRGGGGTKRFGKLAPLGRPES